MLKRMTHTDIWALWIELPNTLILQTWEHHISLQRKTPESAITQAMTSGEGRKKFEVGRNFKRKKNDVK
jgi:hypothetical protein